MRFHVALPVLFAFLSLAGACSSSTGGATNGTQSSSGSTSSSSGTVTGKPFACDTMICQPGEYCEAVAPGFSAGGSCSGGLSYMCIAIPSSCAAPVTCDCVKKAAGDCGCGSTQVTCTEDAPGAFVVECGCP